MLKPECINSVIEMLQTTPGREQLLGFQHVRVPAVLRGFHCQTEWWRDSLAAGLPAQVSIPSYKRTPVSQRFPTVASGTEIVTTGELLERAADKANASLTEELEQRRTAESSDYLGAAEALLREEFFAMRAQIPKCEGQQSDVSQCYLNLDANGQPVYLQLGWLDCVGFGKGSGLSNFRDQRFLHFETLSEVRAFDHLVTVGVIEMTP